MTFGNYGDGTEAVLCRLATRSYVDVSAKKRNFANVWLWYYENRENSVWELYADVSSSLPSIL